MKATNFIRFLSFWLLNFPVFGEAQQPFSFESSWGNLVPKSPLIINATSTDSIAINTAIIDLTKQLSVRGFFEPSIDSILSNDVTQRIYFTTGKRRLINRILDQDGQDHCPEVYQFYYDLTLIENCLSSFIQKAESDGFLFAKISINKIKLEADSFVTVELSVDRGSQIEVSNLEFVGNNNLSGGILKRMAGWKTPVIFSSDDILKTVQHLNRSPFIRIAQYAGLSSDNVAYFSIEETRSNDIDIIIGLEPGLSDGYSIVGQGRLRLNHLLTPASRFDMDFYRAGSGDSRLSFSYHQYSIKNTPFGIASGITFSQVDSTYLNFAINGTTSFRIDPNRKVSAGLDYQVLTGSDYATNTSQLDQRRIIFKLDYHLDTIDRLIAPTSGSTIRASVSSGFVTITDENVESNQPSGYRVNEFNLLINRYVSINRQLVLMASQNVTHRLQDIFFDADRLRFGGTNSMRGYREQQFRLAGFSLSTVETRWMLDRSSYLYAFLNGAYTWTPDQLGTILYSFEYSTLFSGGIGISYRVRPGFLNVSYAVSNDDSWLNGKIHFGIVNSF